MNVHKTFRTEAVAQRFSVKKDVLRKSTTVSSLTKLQCDFINKDTLAPVFSCEFLEISKNTFYRIPPVAASIRRRPGQYTFSLRLVFRYLDR